MPRSKTNFNQTRAAIAHEPGTQGALATGGGWRPYRVPGLNCAVHAAGVHDAASGVEVNTGDPVAVALARVAWKGTSQRLLWNRMLSAVALESTAGPGVRAAGGDGGQIPGAGRAGSRPRRCPGALGWLLHTLQHPSRRR